MSKVIKDNNGVAIVEGTPAASLIKDADKFFAAKIDTRMAGEAVQPKSIERIAQAGRIDTRPGKGSEEAMAAAALTKPMMQMIDGVNTVVGYMLDGETTMFNEAQMNLPPLQKADLLPRRVTAAMQGGDPRGKGKELDPKEINTKEPTAADLEQMNNPPGKKPMAAEEAMALSLGLDKEAITSQTKPFTTSQGTFTGTNTITKGQADAINRGLSSAPVKPRTEPTTDPDVIEALNLARDFKRQRSAKEAQRSQEERDATRGKFISTLRR
tara:strand:- start:42 stop:848 length:807 start_codon:yes stop_codon:yes gene_type:complete